MDASDFFAESARADEKIRLNAHRCACCFLFFVFSLPWLVWPRPPLVLGDPLDAGIDFLQKPYALIDLLKKIRDVLEK